MDKKKFFLVFGLLFLFSLASVSAFNFPPYGSSDLGTFQQNKTVTLFQSCSNCSYVTLTSVNFPDGTTINLNAPMTKDNYSYSYNFSDTNKLGDYKYTTCGDKGGTLLCETIDFLITPSGETFTTARGISYLGFLLLTLLLLISTIIGGFKMRWKHTRNDEGKIITINDFRYIKVFLFSMAYMIAMFLFGLSYKLFHSAGMQGFDTFFNFIYQLFLRLMYPILVATVVIMFVIFLSNLKLKKKRGMGL